MAKDMVEIGKDINKAKILLEAGKLVGIPTETVYGLAANGLDSQAVSKIFVAKNRPSFDPLILHTDSIDKLNNFVKEVPKLAYQLAEAFWPGSLTIVFPKKEIVPALVTSGLDTMAVRIPKHPLALNLLEKLSFPLAAPSANPFGYVSPTTAQHVANNLGDKLDYILDGGICEVGVESTIVGFMQLEPIVLRKGGLPIEAIEEVIGKVKVQALSSSRPQAPGMLAKHYSPGIKLVIGNIPDLMEKYKHEDFAVLSFKENYILKQKEKNKILSPTGDLSEAARNLFAFLRYFTETKPSVILTELVPERGLGIAINDRLKRAATQ